MVCIWNLRDKKDWSVRNYEYDACAESKKKDINI